MEELLIKQGIIYIIEHNTICDLKYIGQSKNSLKTRWQSHLSSCKNADIMSNRIYFFMNYYGIENFTIREYKIYNNITQEFLNKEEKTYIKELGTLNTNYSNEDITKKITNILKYKLIENLIDKDTEISKIYRLVDVTNKNLFDTLLKNKLIDKLKAMGIHDMLDNYMIYIDYFHKMYEITDNKTDTYSTEDLMYKLCSYVESNYLFDYNCIKNVKEILEYYFDLLDIHLDKDRMYCITEKEQPKIINIITQNNNKQIADKKASMTAYNKTEAGVTDLVIQVITIPKPPTDRQAVMLNYYTTNKKVLLDKQKAKYANDLVYQQAVKAIAYLNNRQGSTPKDASKIKHKLYEQNGRWYSEIVEDRKKAKEII